MAMPKPPPPFKPPMPGRARVKGAPPGPMPPPGAPPVNPMPMSPQLPPAPSDTSMLDKIGWPDLKAIEDSIENGDVQYGEVISKLNQLADSTNDKATKRKARSAIVRLQKKFKGSE